MRSPPPINSVSNKYTYLAQYSVLRHHLNTVLRSHDHLHITTHTKRNRRRHVDEQTVIHDASDLLDLAVHLLGVVNSIREAQVDDVVAVVRHQTTINASIDSLRLRGILLAGTKNGLAELQ